MSPKTHNSDGAKRAGLLLAVMILQHLVQKKHVPLLKKVCQFQFLKNITHRASLIRVKLGIVVTQAHIIIGRDRPIYRFTDIFPDI